MAAILGGGYPPQRSLSRAKRLAVVERDQIRCRLCGAAGEEIDHIDGSSSDLSNLRLLCQACHRKVTGEHLVPANREEVEQARALWARVIAAQPGRLCDDDQRWASGWRSLLAERQQWLWASNDLVIDETYLDLSGYNTDGSVA